MWKAEVLGGGGTCKTCLSPLGRGMGCYCSSWLFKSSLLSQKGLDKDGMYEQFFELGGIIIRKLEMNNRNGSGWMENGYNDTGDQTQGRPR